MTQHAQFIEEFTQATGARSFERLNVVVGVSLVDAHLRASALRLENVLCITLSALPDLVRLKQPTVVLTPFAAVSLSKEDIGVLNNIVSAS